MENILLFVTAVFAAGCFCILCKAHPEQAVQLLRAYDNFWSELFLWFFKMVIWGTIIVLSLLLGLVLFTYFADQASAVAGTGTKLDKHWLVLWAAAILSGFTVGILLPAFLIGWWYEKRWWE